MHLFIWFCCMQVCCLTAWSASTLRSSDTAITVSANDSAPRVLEVRGAGSVWMNAAADPLIAVIYVNGKPVPVRWRFDGAASASNAETVRFVYESATPHLRLDWVWQRRADLGPIEHSIHIENLTGRTILLPLEDSLCTRWHVPASRQLENFWVEKGAGGPSDVGTHLVRMSDGYAWTGTSSTYAHPRPGQSREMIPYTLLEGPGGRGMYLGIEFSGRTRITVARSGDAVTEVAGLNPSRDRSACN